MPQILRSLSALGSIGGRFYSLFFGIPWLIVLSWVLVNGQSLFPEVWSDSWTATVTIYIILDAIFIGMSATLQYKNPKTSNLPQNSLGFAIIFGSIGFVITWFTMYIIRYFVQYTSSTPTQMALWATLVLQVIVVAASEEVIFRGLIIDMLSTKLSFTISALISSIAFAVFHYAAYGGLTAFMIVAFALGMIWAYTRKYVGLGASIGSHSAYNLSIAGIIVFAPACILGISYAIGTIFIIVTISFLIIFNKKKVNA